MNQRGQVNRDPLPDHTQRPPPSPNIPQPICYMGFTMMLVTVVRGASLAGVAGLGFYASINPSLNRPVRQRNRSFSSLALFFFTNNSGCHLLLPWIRHFIWFAYHTHPGLFINLNNWRSAVLWPIVYRCLGRDSPNHFPSSSTSFFFLYQRGPILEP